MTTGLNSDQQDVHESVECNYKGTTFKGTCLEIDSDTENKLMVTTGKREEREG